MAEIELRVVVDGDSGKLPHGRDQQARPAGLERDPKWFGANPGHLDHSVAWYRHNPASAPVGVDMQEHEELGVLWPDSLDGGSVRLIWGASDQERLTGPRPDKTSYMDARDVAHRVVDVRVNADRGRDGHSENRPK